MITCVNPFLFGGGGGGSSLLTDLAAAWSLNSTLNDESGNGRTLTDGNANLGYATGLVYSNAGDFVRANSVYATQSNSALYPASGDYTIETWVRLTDNSGASDLLSIFCNGAGGGSDGLWFWCRQSDFLIQAQYELSGTQRNITVFPSGFTHSTWFQFIWELDRAGNSQVWMDNVSVGSISISAQSGNMTPAFPVNLGRYGSGAHYLHGRQGPTRIWKRILTSGEKTSLYNSGAGLVYPF